ncbi:poly(A) polymerase [Cladophialophora psammophila CBS 110553]|uniref:Poly(A) polymerase n=1 Tax=Cladophialophora psammophila CBS 110553 TaxID=1182543 RepID=W9VNF3_9EURO|nr:poly(A) polymerase [Cladophialophora psammophila CBS 110553]EXJ53661.1 poly(A) polymerase [Cladophialophora psammophila CBS 110553]
MAGNDRGGAPMPSFSLDSIDHLRRVAENHLKEIDEERQQEQKEEMQRTQDLEHYAKHRKRGKEDKPIMPSEVPVPKMRSAQDVLNRLQWDASLDMSQYLIGYLERFAGIKEIPASQWISETTEEEWIPQHRIKYFKRLCQNGDDEIVWHREKRIDKIFSSGLTSTNAEESDKVDVRSEDGGVSLLP